MLKVGCVIPCYKGSSKTLEVVQRTLDSVDVVVLVDDACPNETGRFLLSELGFNRDFCVIFNKQNSGVGKSSVIGFHHLMDLGCDIVVKLDADGQMNPGLIKDLIKPIAEDCSEACKGNRFSRIDDVLSMPKVRLLGNLGLSFLSKLSTGYWELFDPTNGFIAFKSSALRRVRLDKVDKRYFFESDLLFQCGLAQITFSQLSMASVYGDEQSSLRPLVEIGRFSSKHMTNFLKRIVYQYFLLDFNAGSLELLFGLFGIIIVLIFVFSLIIGGVFNQRFATAGESGLLVIATVITAQMLIGFLYYDSMQQPLLRRLKVLSRRAKDFIE